MALTGVLRPSHVQIRVKDLTAAVAHYTNIIGLTETARGDDGRVYFKAWDEFDHHSIVLREAEMPGMDVMGFKVASDADLDKFAKDIASFGLEVEEFAPGTALATGRRIAFTAPTGHHFELMAEREQVGNGLPTTNPDVWPDHLHGMAPSWFDHCLLYGDDIDGVMAMFTEVLGFSLTEKIVAGDGMLIGVFLTSNNKTHDVAFIRHEQKDKFHHASFYVGEWSSIERAADIIRKHNVPRDIGPTKHGISRGSTIYFFDPSGNRNEVFAGGYMHFPDRPVITWTEDQLGKAIFYYEGELNENFLSTVT